VTAPRHDEAGFVGGLEAIVFGLLIFVTGTLIAASAWAVVDTKFATVAAAREAARSYVEAPIAERAGTDALGAARAALAGYGRLPGPATVRLVGGDFGRCHRVTIEVSYPAPLVSVPFVGRLGRGETVRSRHSELVDPYRSGLPGAAACG
jgi:hypothetical protein